MGREPLPARAHHRRLHRHRHPGGRTCTAGPGATSCTITGLTNATTYQVAITAHTPTGGTSTTPATTSGTRPAGQCSSPSHRCAPTTPASPAAPFPPAPTGSSASPTGATSPPARSPPSTPCPQGPSPSPTTLSPPPGRTRLAGRHPWRRGHLQRQLRQLDRRRRLHLQRPGRRPGHQPVAESVQRLHRGDRRRRRRDRLLHPTSPTGAGARFHPITPPACTTPAAAAGPCPPGPPDAPSTFPAASTHRTGRRPRHRRPRRRHRHRLQHHRHRQPRVRLAGRHHRGGHPAASTVNWTGGASTAHGQFVKLEGNRSVTLFNGSGAGVHAIIDIVGYFTEGDTSGGNLFHAPDPGRAYDSRSPAPDNQSPLASQSVRTVSTANSRAPQPPAASSSPT